MHAGISKTGSTSATSCWFGRRARPVNVVGRLPLLFSACMLPANGDTNRRKQPNPVQLFAHSDHVLSRKSSARTRISPGSGPFLLSELPKCSRSASACLAPGAKPIPTW